MPLAKRLTVVQAMAFAFPRLKNDREWNAPIDGRVGELRPNVDEHADIVIEARKIISRLKRNLVR